MELNDLQQCTDHGGATENETDSCSQDSGATMYGDAIVKTPYREADYEFLIKVALGSDSKSMNWKTVELPCAAVIGMLCQHKEGAKDGKSIVFADMVNGQRLRNAVRSNTAIGLDIDNGTPSDLIDQALKRLNCLSVRYTTYSHLRTTSLIKKDDVIRFLRKEDGLTDQDSIEITTTVMQRYLTHKKQAPWYPPHAETVELEDDAVHEATGIMIKVRHAPMHKNRVVVFLKRPYDMAMEAQTQQEALQKFARLPTALGHMLGIEIDKACTDPCRLFYLPRHEKNKPFSISLFGGDLFDFTTMIKPQAGDHVDAMAKEVGKKTSKSVTERGRALGKWFHEFSAGFQLMDVIQDHVPEKVRSKATLGYNIECPFDSGHSNAGDPDDQACFAANAAEGGNEFPIASCRHGSCRQYTMLDMIGRMIEDNWFPQECLTDPHYDIVDHGNGDADDQFAGTGKGPKASEKSGDGYGGALAFGEKRGPIPNGVSYDKESGEIHRTFRNALLLIGYEGWDLGYNELSQNYGMRGNVQYPWPEHLGYALNDAIRREIRLYMLRRWDVTFKIQDVEEATMTLARRNAFNPVCDYLDDVEQQWDGVHRVDQWLEIYLGVKTTDANRDYVRSIGRIVLVAAVRRARQPGCKFDEMLILEGPQGGGKSTVVRLMGVEWFSDANLGDVTKKEAAMKLRNVWLQEVAELAALKKAEVDELKEFTSYQSDRYKIPYAKSEEDFPRRCIFIGTVNPGGGAYLVDLTGNRRFWPVACGEIDLDALARDRDQLWAEAAMMETRGDSIRLSPSLYAAAKAEQDARLADDPWVERLAEHLEGLNPKVGMRVLSMTLLDVLEVPTDRQTQQTMKKLKGAMAHIPTWEYKASMRTGGTKSSGYEFIGVEAAVGNAV